MKHALLIAYHFPPVAGSSGVLRTLKFSRYLPEFGWQPSVLSVHPRAYERVSDAQLAEVPEQMTVVRTFALDAARHLAVAGRYSRWFALPDRWSSWLLGAIPSGLKMIRHQRPTVLWSTYPMPTAHLAGFLLHRLTGLPWVADCRDSMLDDSYPSDPLKRKAHAWLERQVVTTASRVIFTTTGTLQMYAERYPEIPRNRWVLIANGFDEADFCGKDQCSALTNTHSRKLILLHSGLIDPIDRDPRPFLFALAELKERGRISAQKIKILFRAPGSGSEIKLLSWISAHGLDDIVEVAPPLQYAEALAEMAEVDALLLFQGKTCNHQIPAKIYEYLRVGHPIIGLIDPAGDTAALLQEAGVNTILPLDDKDALIAALPGLLEQLKAGSLPVSPSEIIASYSRRERTAELAAVFEQVAAV